MSMEYLKYQDLSRMMKFKRSIKNLNKFMVWYYKNLSLLEMETILLYSGICPFSFGLRQFTDYDILTHESKFKQQIINKLKKYNDSDDIDIIDFNGICTSTKYKNEEIIIPHKNMHKRNFVLLPLYEINKDWIHPKYKKNIVNLLSKLSNIDLRSIKLI